MKKFGQLHVRDQCALLAYALYAMIKAGDSKVGDIARAVGVSPLEWWYQVCAGAGFDRCEPWPGFPDVKPVVDLPIRGRTPAFENFKPLVEVLAERYGVI
jgi:hypothetical protein